MSHSVFSRPETELIVEELPENLEAWPTFRRLAALPLAIFLDSAMPHPVLGRYSYLAADPFERLISQGAATRPGDAVAAAGAENSFVRLERHLARFRTVSQPGLPPFQGGAMGFFGYALGRELEKLPPAPLDDFQIPDMIVGIYDWVIAFDHVSRRVWLISTGWPEIKRRRRRERAARRIRQVRAWLADEAGPPIHEPGQSPDRLAPRWQLPIAGNVYSNFERLRYLETIARAVDYVHAGDCFQVNIAQRLLRESTEAPLHLYERLRQRNPAPFAAYLNLGPWIIASASPERFLRVDGREVQTRPIKGTAPRSELPLEDAQRQAALLASAKDRSENVMIVDLLRNDLGRVCEYGSIAVSALCRLESYRYVHHLVSEVRGRLRPGKGALDLLQAAFPGGSVTGAPKIRAMEIISELEPSARGPYCGSAGFIGFNGNMDTSILIRTFTIGKGWVQFPVGGGIVADSKPEREYEETLHKAEGMLRALEP